MNTAQRAQAVLRLLQVRYPTPQTHLVAAGAWQLLVATVLSAQCTDARVNMVTPVLFGRWPDAAALAEAPLLDVEKVIHSTGFYHNKAKNIIAAAQAVTRTYGGQVPQSLEALITLPGVARKTANVVLWGAFGINEGLAVDTHVKRICLRLGLTDNTNPVAVEQDLMRLFPREEWGQVNHRLVWFGRHVCDARKPLCHVCEMRELCVHYAAHPPSSS
ncbi:MAG: endonuclease III [Desulfovibrionaceae bacterium]